MQQTTVDSTRKYIGDIKGIVHNDDTCKCHWNPAILKARTVEEIFDSVPHYGIELTPTTEPKYIEYEKPMSMFARAYNGEISSITQAIFAKPN